MQTRRIWLLMLLWGVIAPLLPAPARADDKEVRKQLEAIHDQYLQAFRAKDAGQLRLWFERYLAPDALEIDLLNKRRNRRQIIDEARQLQTSWLAASEVTGKIEQLTVTGSEAVAVFSDRLVRSMPDPQDTPASPRPPHELVLLASERNTWVRTPGGWKCSLSVNLTGQATLDGKPLSLPGAPPPDHAAEDAKPGSNKPEKAPEDSKPPR